MRNAAAAVAWNQAPEGFDTIAEELRALRFAAGTPSYSEIAKRVGEHRLARGVPAHEQTIARSTVYEYFRDGKRRLDIDVLVEIALALGLPEHLREDWRARVRAARAAGEGSAVVTGHSVVPRPVATFSGRGAAIADAEAVHAPIWISGMGGAGKTQLALTLAARSQREGVFVDVRGFRAESPTVEVEAAQRTILRLLGVERAEGDDEAARAQRIRSTLDTSGKLLVLDDAPGPAYVERVLGTPAAHALVTSRNSAASAGWHLIALDGLDEDDVSAMVSASVADDVDADVARRLHAVTGGLPLAVALVCSRIAAHPTWTIDDHLELVESRAHEGRIGDRLHSTLDASYADLTDRTATLLRAFADLPVAELTYDAIAAVLNTNEDEAITHAAELVTANLAISRGDRGIALHALVRAFAREKAETTDAPRTRRERFARVGWFYADRVWAAYETISASIGADIRNTNFAFSPREWDRTAAEEWLTTRLTAILAVAHGAPGRGEPELLFRISEGLSWWCNFAMHHDEAIALHEAAVAEASDRGDADALAMASLDLGQILAQSQRSDDAYECFQRAQRLISDAGELSDPGVYGVILNMLALLEMRHFRHDDAIELLQRARDIHRERGEHLRYLSANVNLAVALHNPGRFDEELAVLDEALPIAVEHGLTLLETNIVINQVGARHETGDLDGAVDAGRRAVELADELGAPYYQFSAYAALAGVEEARGDLASARRLCDHALEMAREARSDQPLAAILIVDATISVRLDERDRATRALDEAEGLLPGDGDPDLHGQIALQRGDLADDPDERRAWWQRALATFESAGSFYADHARQRLDTVMAQQ